ncbi:Unknown protein sequence [Pseudomonas amygdali pv. lachrymans]|uniref:Uncharacterized protein n=1 Tax=Pseudomonas amygdali pv. lachrymans TaxID=53707 RepID=A0A0P9UYY3_PSEAV|nr:Unknown protein sequence [Pseudomonas amygdali pv. lachrymans]
MLREIEAIEPGCSDIDDIATFGQTLMHVLGSFRLVLYDKDSHNQASCLMNG